MAIDIALVRRGLTMRSHPQPSTCQCEYYKYCGGKTSNSLPKKGLYDCMQHRRIDLGPRLAAAATTSPAASLGLAGDDTRDGQVRAEGCFEARNMNGPAKKVKYSRLEAAWPRGDRVLPPWLKDWQMACSRVEN